MMKVRLDLAKDLLSDDGVIFISIDDSEQAYLKVLCDEIFGEENFVNQLVWVSNKKGRQITTNKMFAQTYEYILMYSKNDSFDKKAFLDFSIAHNLMPSLYEKKKVIAETDEESDYIIQNELYNSNIKLFNSDTRPNLFFPIYTDGEKISLQKDNENFIELLPPISKGGKQGVWRWSKNKVLLESKNLRVIPWKDTYKLFTKKRNQEYLIKDLIISPKFTTKSGGSDLVSLGIEETFNFPKPTALISFLLSFFTSNFTILDFFAGSGTIGQAVMELNHEDGGDRKFILCTNDENNIVYKSTYERLYRIIKGQGTKGEKFDWMKNNEPFYDEKLLVFDINHHDVSFQSTEKLADIKNEAIQSFKLLSNQYNDFNVYYDLSGLNPYKKEGKGQNETN